MPDRAAGSSQKPQQLMPTGRTNESVGEEEPRKPHEWGLMYNAGREREVVVSRENRNEKQKKYLREFCLLNSQPSQELASGQENNEYLGFRRIGCRRYQIDIGRRHRCHR